MSLHDAFARFTPYELLFPGLSPARAHFHAIRSEADARQVDARDPSSFIMLAATGQAVSEIRSAEDDPALIRQYGLLLYHAFHFREQGEELYLIETGALRELLDEAPEILGWKPSLGETSGHAAGYAQLPQHLVWVRSEEEAMPRIAGRVLLGAEEPRNTLSSYSCSGCGGSGPAFRWWLSQTCR